MNWQLDEWLGYPSLIHPGWIGRLSAVRAANKMMAWLGASPNRWSCDSLVL